VNTDRCSSEDKKIKVTVTAVEKQNNWDQCSYWANMTVIPNESVFIKIV
jgi:hypothetical protein